MATDESLAVRVEIAPAGELDAVRLEELTASLRRELSDLDVESVEQVAGTAPPAGAKVGEVLALGALVVKVAKSAGPVLAVVRALQECVRLRKSTVKVPL